MRVLGLIGVVAFALASATVGVRLLLLARRTRQAPELAMGIAFLVSGAIGFPLLTGASVVVETGGSTGLAHVLMALGALSTFAGYVGLGIGCWRIYRPAERWPLAPIGLGTAVLLGATATVAASSGAAQAATRDLAFWSGICVGSLTFAWNAVESFLLHGQLRRRASLGLADPEVVSRVLMWGVGSAAAWAMTMHGLVLRATIGPVVADGHRIVASGIGLVAAVAISLAFFPPAAYRRRFAAPADRTGSA
jgi:hypothetical protein